MKKNIIAIAMMAAAFAATESVNAQSFNSNALVSNLLKKADIAIEHNNVVVVNGDTTVVTTVEPISGPSLASDALTGLSAKTYYRDDEKLVVKFPVAEESRDSVSLTWTIRDRRNADSGGKIGIRVGCAYVGDNLTPTFGIAGEYVFKKLSFEAAIEKAWMQYNSESDLANKKFDTTIFTFQVGYNAKRWSSRGYNNMVRLSVGPSFKYVLDRNHNLTSSSTYETDTQIITEEGYRAVKGSSMFFGMFAKMSFVLKQLGMTSGDFSIFGGVYDRYYVEGSRVKPMFGVNATIYFSMAPIRVDSDVNRIKNDLKSGDLRLINEVINQARANAVK